MAASSHCVPAFAPSLRRVSLFGGGAGFSSCRGRSCPRLCVRSRLSGLPCLSVRLASFLVLPAHRPPRVSPSASLPCVRLLLAPLRPKSSLPPVKSLRPITPLRFLRLIRIIRIKITPPVKYVSPSKPVPSISTTNLQHSRPHLDAIIPKPSISICASLRRPPQKRIRSFLLNSFIVSIKIYSLPFTQESAQLIERLRGYAEATLTYYRRDRYRKSRGKDICHYWDGMNVNPSCGRV